ncbi:hypothetical protein [Loktanella sp. Alg231-35]|nr:hypothetical protein [Loktanella sp. Alg231-35]
MSDKDTKRKTDKTATTREDRLKAALKANMAKRKAQARARAQKEERE